MGSAGQGTLFIVTILVLGTVNLAAMGNNYASPLPFTGIAKAQTPDLGTDNSTDDLGSLPTDNSTDLNSLLADNSTTGNSANTGSTSDGSSQGSSSVTTPEFGPAASIVLVLLISSIIIISARTRLKFSRS